MMVLKDKVLINQMVKLMMMDMEKLEKMLIVNSVRLGSGQTSGRVGSKNTDRFRILH
jgi:hypothetical protein